VKKIGIAMLGYGGIGRVHALAYRALPYHYGFPAQTIHLVGVATTRPETAEQAAREIGCEVWTADYHELLTRPDVDMVDICVPNHKHEELIVAAAQAGKHIYCEKPLAMNVAEGQRIIEAVEKAGIKSQLNFNFRFFPAITRARQLMQAGFVGRVFSFRGCYYRSSYISADKPLSWRLRRDIAGGGALFDLGSHALDLIYYLLGDFASVFGTVDTLIKERPVAAGSSQKAPVDVDDIALLHLRMADGAIGSVEVSRLGTGATNLLAIEIFGDKGALRFNSEDSNWLEVFDARDADQPLGGMSGYRKVQTASRHEGQKAPDWTMPADFVRTHAESQYQFLKSIAEDRPSSPTLADGLRVQEAMAAAIRSSAEGRWITVAEVRN
jgi:predicted dehydrogenase